MAQYFFLLILSFVFFVGMAAFLWLIFKKKKNNGDSYKIETKNILVLVFFILLSGALFVYSLLDLPNVLANKTDQYKGNCEVWVFESARGGHTSVEFENHNIMFPENYQGAVEGSYYCEVEYYPRTEHGKSLKLYKSKRGNLINSKKVSSSSIRYKSFRTVAATAAFFACSIPLTKQVYLRITTYKFNLMETLSGRSRFSEWEVN